MTVPRSWKQMSSGKGVDLANPKPEDIDWNDVAISLSLQCRFGGCMRDVHTFYSVAQHSVLVASLVKPEYRLRALLHDAHEAYVQDLTTPMKWALEEHYPETSEAFAALAERWDLAIWSAAMMAPPSDEEDAAVKRADTMALSIERRDLLNPPADDMTRAAWAWLPEPDPRWLVRPCMPNVAWRMFTDTLGSCLWSTRPWVGAA